MAVRDLNRMDHLTWPEFHARIKRAVLILPLGSVEQHGYHMPLGVDAQIPLHLALATAQRFPAVVAPPLWYGYKSQPRSGGGGSFPGTTSFDGNTVTACVRDLIRDFARQGQTFISVLNGHMENSSFAGEGIDLALREVPNVDTKVVLINWWEHVGNELIDQLFPEGFPGWEAEHASLTETALMSHFLPHLVMLDRLGEQEEYRPVPRYSVWPEPSGLVPKSGVLYQAHGVTAENGATLADHIVDRIVEVLRKEFPTLKDGD